MSNLIEDFLAASTHTRKCYCDDAEHEMCYDNIIGMYDDACSCCKETSQESEVDA